MGVLRLQPKGIVGFGEVALDLEVPEPKESSTLLHCGRWSLEIPKGFDEKHLKRLLAVLELHTCS